MDRELGVQVAQGLGPRQDLPLAGFVRPVEQHVPYLEGEGRDGGFHCFLRSARSVGLNLHPGQPHRIAGCHHDLQDKAILFGAGERGGDLGMVIAEGLQRRPGLRLRLGRIVVQPEPVHRPVPQQPVRGGERRFDVLQDLPLDPFDPYLHRFRRREGGHDARTQRITRQMKRDLRRGDMAGQYHRKKKFKRQGVGASSGREMTTGSFTR